MTRDTDDKTRDFPRQRPASWENKPRQGTLTGGQQKKRGGLAQPESQWRRGRRRSRSANATLRIPDLGSTVHMMSLVVALCTRRVRRRRFQCVPVHGSRLCTGHSDPLVSSSPDVVSLSSCLLNSSKPAYPGLSRGSICSYDWTDPQTRWVYVRISPNLALPIHGIPTHFRFDMPHVTELCPSPRDNPVRTPKVSRAFTTGPRGP